MNKMKISNATKALQELVKSITVSDPNKLIADITNVSSYDKTPIVLDNTSRRNLEYNLLKNNPDYERLSSEEQRELVDKIHSVNTL